MEPKCEERIPQDILYDLISRFIINIPEDERKNMVRICFQIEFAHWFYLDRYCTDDNPHLKHCGLKEFTALILKHIPDMQHQLKNLDAIMCEFKEYKRAVPTFGAIVLDTDLTHVLLVQSFFSRSSWGFPKGKVNEEEPPEKCAVREVFEETGFDISDLIDDNDYIELTWNDQLTRLYLIPGVDRSTEFCPRTQMEIKAVEWFPLADLPTDRKATPRTKKGLNPKNFSMVLPFVKRIRQWVGQRQGHHQRHKSVSDSDMPGRHRQKSIAENDNLSKSLSKQQYLFTTSLQKEVQDLENAKNFKGNSSLPVRSRGNSKRSSIKRQLFTGDEDKTNRNPKLPQSSGESSGSRPEATTTPKSLEKSIFISKCWTSFKFDRDSIWSTFEPPILRNQSVIHVC